MNVSGINSGVTLATPQNSEKTDSGGQSSLPVSVVDLATEALLNDALALLAGEGPPLKTQSSEAQSTVPQALTARTQSLLSANQYYVEALTCLWENNEFQKRFRKLVSSHPVLAEDIKTSLDKIKKHLAAGVVQHPFANHESLVDQSQIELREEISALTLLLAKAPAFGCKTALFEKALSLAGQPTMQLIHMVTQSPEHSESPERPDLSEKLKVGLKKAGFLDDATQAINLSLFESSNQRARNTMLLQLTPANADGVADTPQPLRLFFVSGASPMPDELFSSQSANNANTMPKVMDLCEGGATSVTRAGILNAKFKKLDEGIKWLTDKINEARSSDRVLAIDSTVLEKLGIGLKGHQKDVPTVSDSPHQAGGTTNPRDHDTEHMAVSFLLKMGEKLGLNAKGKDNKPVRYTLDIFSRLPVCRSCHLGLAMAVTNDAFPRLTEFNVVYGSPAEPKPKK